MWNVRNGDNRAWLHNSLTIDNTSMEQKWRGPKLECNKVDYATYLFDIKKITSSTPPELKISRHSETMEGQYSRSRHSQHHR